MKALVTAFALLSFVAAATVPYAASAATTQHQTKHHKKHVKHVVHHTKHMHHHNKKPATT